MLLSATRGAAQPLSLSVTQRRTPGAMTSQSRQRLARPHTLTRVDSWRASAGSELSVGKLVIVLPYRVLSPVIPEVILRCPWDNRLSTS
ncbi:hypothetical protein BaRGS_00023787 [Batillaria attramentaria]|uniref:Uncharacterized protein n=1 Tax=Batillaria attramentaria TaxID=370345 RepID=A0ABD0KD35_9CAEN